MDRLFSPDRLPWTFLLLAVYLWTCLRVARRVGRTGRSPWKWFVITMFLTAIPAAVVLIRDMRDRARAKRDASDSEPTRPTGAPGDRSRCPHCGKRVRPEELDRASGAPACPHCRMVIDEARYA